MRLLVGVDAGGSRTIAAARHGDEAPATYSAPGGNAQLYGIETAADAIEEAITHVCDGATPSAIAVGAAGAGRESVRLALTDALRARFAGTPLAVGDDTAIALRGAIPSGDAIVLVAGTGSVTYAEIGNRCLRVGGGGYAIGDDGSGYAIGSAALRMLLRALEGRATRDPLLEALAEHLRCSDAQGLIAAVYERGAPVKVVASTAPIVLDYADAGERSAVKIVQTAALDLFDLVRAIVRQAGLEAGEIPLALRGGVLLRNSMLTYLLETRIAGELPQMRVVKGGGEPYVGALAQAASLVS